MATLNEIPVADLLKLNGKILCGDSDGGPLKVERVEFKEDAVKGEDTLFLVLSGKATHMLRHSHDPKEGGEPIRPDTLDEFSWEQSIRLGGDNKMSIDKLNKTFKFAAPLVDNDESIFRFSGDHPESVLDAVRTTPGYVYLSVKAATNEKYGPNVWPTFTSIAERKDAGAVKYADLLKKWGKKVTDGDGILADEGTKLFP